MEQAFVVAGGTLDDALISRLLDERQPGMVIAADAGLDFFYRNRRVPDIIVGDFDSAQSPTLAHFRKVDCVEIITLNPIKDDTDTEAAVRLAIARGARQITLLGATGSRLDHVLANIELLGIGFDAGITIELVDANNRIRMLREGLTLHREEQFGDYVSLLPYSEKVEHLTLRGFKYPLTDYSLEGFCSLGVSNEIEEEEAVISFDGGILILIESRD